HALAPSLPEPKPRQPASGGAKAAKAASKPDPAFSSADSRTWRVAFRVTLPLAHPGRAQSRRKIELPEPALRIKPREHARMLHTWPLARRLEAATRAVHDPLAHIRRLARQIRRLGAICVSRLARPQRTRIPRAWATLDALGEAMGVERVRRDDSS